MSDFRDPKYTSYVHLCRELRLNRQFREGDWVVHDGEFHVGTPRLVFDSFSGGVTEDDVWLPLLGDWLEMLEKAGCEDVAFFHEDPDWSCQQAPYDVSLAWDQYPASGNRPTREEAAAWLWMTITKVP